MEEGAGRGDSGQATPTSTLHTQPASVLSKVELRGELCPPYLRSLVEDTVQAFNDSWLLPPVEREVFESGEARLTRLQGSALSSRFAVVTTASRAGRFRFAVMRISEVMPSRGVGALEGEGRGLSHLEVIARGGGCGASYPVVV